MAIHISTVGYPIPASSTSSQSANIAAGQQCKFIRVVNGSTSALCFVNAGASTVAATSNNIAVPPGKSRTFYRDPNTQPYVAVLLSTSTGTVSVSPCNEDSTENA